MLIFSRVNEMNPSADDAVKIGQEAAVLLRRSELIEKEASRFAGMAKKVGDKTKPAQKLLAEAERLQAEANRMRSAASRLVERYHATLPAAEIVEPLPGTQSPVENSSAEVVDIEPVKPTVPPPTASVKPMVEILREARQAPPPPAARGSVEMPGTPMTPKTDPPSMLIREVDRTKGRGESSPAMAAASANAGKPKTGFFGKLFGREKSTPAPPAPVARPSRPAPPMFERPSTEPPTVMLKAKEEALKPAPPAPKPVMPATKPVAEIPKPVIVPPPPAPKPVAPKVEMPPVENLGEPKESPEISVAIPKPPPPPPATVMPKLSPPPPPVAPVAEVSLPVSAPAPVVTPPVTELPTPPVVPPPPAPAVPSIPPPKPKPMVVAVKPPPPKFVVCHCEHCGQGVEFEAALLSEDNCVIPCPGCGEDMKLSVS